MAVIEHIMDKAALSRTAQSVGLDVPRTFACQSVQALEEILEQIAFPVVVKPRYAFNWRQTGAWRKVGARKAFVVRSHQQLLDEYRSVSQVQPEVVLQEFIPGVDSDLVICGCYISRTREMLGHFTARKIIQSPTLFGTGCVVEACDTTELIAVTAKLLHACHYSGIAEVEYKHDPATERYCLIEINPRHWDQHQLGTKVGINLSWIAYNDYALNKVLIGRPMYDGRIAWVAEQELFFEMLRRIVSKTAFPMAFSNWWKARYIFGIVQGNDPIPGFFLLKNVLAEMLSTLRRLLRHALSWRTRTTEA